MFQEMEENIPENFLERCMYAEEKPL